MKKSTGIPVLIIAAVLPLTFYFHIESIEFLQYPWFPNQGYWLDWFLFGKGMLLQLMAAVMLIILIGFKIKKRNSTVTLDGGLAITAGICLLFSTNVSSYSQQSFFGSIEQYESIGVLLAYIVLLFFASVYAAEKRNVQLIEKALIAGFVVSCLLGFLQLLQWDFWESQIGRRLLVPDTYVNLRESLRFSEDAAGFERVYMALYNSSYAGIYIVLLLPFLLLSDNKYLKWFSIPAILCLIGTVSKTAWVSALIIGVMGFVLMKKNLKLRLPILIAVSIGVLLLFLPAEDGVRQEEKKLQQISLEKEFVHIVYQGNDIYFSEYLQDGNVKYKIENREGEEISLIWNEERGEMDPTEPQYEGLHFKVYIKDEITYLVLRYEDVLFRFTDDLETGRYEYISNNGKLDELKVAPVVFNAGDGLLNGRGYIWNRTIPLIKENLWLGTGPDTFLQVFPQDDYVARANLGYGFFTEILTNAHSLYLHAILQTGLISFGCMAVIISRYLIRAWRLYAHKESYDQQDKVGIACFLGCVGYLLCGLMFSSSLCTTPIFMILLGTGMGILKRT